MLIDILISKNQKREIILAFDNDHAGQKYASFIWEQYKDVLDPVVDLPEKMGKVGMKFLINREVLNFRSILFKKNS